MMRFSISLFLLLTLNSCALSLTKNLRELPTDRFIVTNTYFSDSDLDYVYKAKLDLYGNYFGGILIIKKIGPREHRVVFTSEFGTKLFDFLLKKDKFTVLSIVEDLDKNLIINTLRTDFQTLLQTEAEVIGKWVATTHVLYKTKAEGRFDFYKYDIASDKVDELQEIVHTSATKEKFSIIFEAMDKQIAEKITIRHQNINLTIRLEKF
ncbi:MAG: hypothetical protein HKM28_06285 [Flavobacteriaceae bacterium]|nr:hypothetical protein [Flavobacteriaceae bacterium]